MSSSSTSRKNAARRGAGPPDDVCALGAAELGRLYRAGDLSPVEVVRRTCDRIARLNPELGAFITVLQDSAAAAAQAAELQLRAGIDLGPLHGVVASVKDVIRVRHTRTTAASKLLADTALDTDDAAAVRRLRAGGAIIVGKTNLSEFCVADTDPEGPFGAVRNPRSMDRHTGGSSSGSAVAVATGESVISLGTDCGGSIRMPAAFCGVAGLKPTYGLVPMDGIVTSSPSLDHAGPLARSIADIAAALAVLAEMPRDRAAPAGGWPYRLYVDALSAEVSGMRLGVPTNSYYRYGQPPVLAQVSRSRETLIGLGLRPVPIELPWAEEAYDATEALLSGDHYAYHEKGILAGAPYGPDFLKQVKRWRETTTADYARASGLRTIIRRDWLTVFDRIDVLVLPASAVPAPKPGVDVVDIGGVPDTLRRANGRFNRVSDLTGFPALTMPVGQTPEGLPLGVQLIGPPFGDARLLTVGYALERALGNLPASWGIEPCRDR